MAEKSWSLGRALRGMFVKPTIDEETWDDLETALLTADFGPEISESILGQLRADVDRLRVAEVKELRGMLRDAIEERLAKFDPTLHLSERPAVILVVGVNGVGKTTTIGKFANYLRAFDKRVIVGAADTFRAAAVEQLATWAERGGAAIVKPQQQGQDPASVAFQTVERAKAEGYDIAIIDTAGRLQNRAELMAEVEKIIRVIKKHDPSAPHTVLLTLDATTGQNALSQVEIFGRVAGVTGLVMTKLDGTARGGILVAIAAKFGLPIHFIGVGEGVDDLEPFASNDFARAIAGIAG